MKRLMTLVAMVAVLAVTPWVGAKGGGYGGKGGKGGGGPYFGIQGTVTLLGTRGFAMSVDGAGEKTEGKDGKPKNDGKASSWQVICNINTKFMMDGKQVSPSNIKVGTHVGVNGGALNQTEFLATEVNIGMPPKGKGKK